MAVYAVWPGEENVLNLKHSNTVQGLPWNL